jgi:hypothetical protein
VLSRACDVFVHGQGKPFCDPNLAVHKQKNKVVVNVSQHVFHESTFLCFADFEFRSSPALGQFATQAIAIIRFSSVKVCLVAGSDFANSAIFR